MSAMPESSPQPAAPPPVAIAANKNAPRGNGSAFETSKSVDITILPKVDGAAPKTVANKVINPLDGLGLVTLGKLKAGNKAKPQTYVIDGLIAEESVNIAVGDSGEGKSPFAYQMAICVTRGLDFLGRSVKRGPVIYVDLENGTLDIEGLVTRLSHHLTTDEPDNELYPITDREHLSKLGSMIAAVRPSLVIIDSLRAFRPEAESKPELAAALINEMKGLAKLYKAAFVFIHHTKKPQDQAPVSLESVPAMEWLNQACGAKALVNQSDTRLAFAKPEKKVSADIAIDARRGEIALIVKGFTRVRGEFGPIYLQRRYDDDGEPIGYNLMTGPSMLFNAQMEEAWHRLPAGEFTRKEAKLIYGKGDSATEAWLRKCKDIGILEQPIKRGLYRKVMA